MSQLIVAFVSPVYFMQRQMWGAFVVNACLYLTACLFLVTFILAFVGVFFWFLGVVHASYYLRKEMMVGQAELLATKMAEKMK